MKKIKSLFQENYGEKYDEKLLRLEVEAKQRFLKLNNLIGSNWSSGVWKYLNIYNVILFDESCEPGELELIGKLYLVDYLWRRRARRSPLRISSVRRVSNSMRILYRVGALGVLDINQEVYGKALQEIGRLKSPTSVVRSLNNLIEFLNKNGLLFSLIDLANPNSFFSDVDKFGRSVLPEKMPLPELVRAIIELKWKIDKHWDSSVRMKLDKLAVLTQAFQYALGLRIGEVLRLPKDCLIDVRGVMYCKVWTEKGAEPCAKYVPSIWRELLKDVVAQIDIICEPYREAARKFEDGSFFDEFDRRFNERVSKIECELELEYAKLHVFLWNQGLQASRKLWTLETIDIHSSIDVRRIRDYLPVAPQSNYIGDIVTFYQRMGLDVISEPIGVRKKRYYVTGQELKARIVEIVNFCSENISFKDFCKLLFGNTLQRKSYYKYFQGLVESKTFPMVEFFAFHPNDEIAKSGTTISYLSRKNARRVLRNVICGGYDFKKNIPFLELGQLFPEIFPGRISRKSNRAEDGLSSELKISTKESLVYSRRDTAKGYQCYAKLGFLVGCASVKESVLSFYLKALNTALSDIDEEDGREVGEIKLESRSFLTRQRVSEFLFVVPTRSGSTYYEEIPTLFGYNQVLHALKPSTPTSKSAFQRYSVSIDQRTARTFQTHQGRHWQTNSMFRAGLSASIVNKWMGRTDVQGAHYDHRTAHERASLVGEMMLSDQSRFLGDLPNAVRRWDLNGIPLDEQEKYLADRLQTLHHGPNGYCMHDLNLRPCVYHLKCLTGDNGSGCREFIYDLDDPVQRKKLEAERDKAEIELARLFEYLQNPDVNIEAVESHIEHQMTIYKNAISILERAHLILNEPQEVHEFYPFREDGSEPGNCVFQCGSTVK